MNRKAGMGLVMLTAAITSSIIIPSVMASAHPSSSDSVLLQSEIKAQLQNDPSGTVIANNQISYDHGNVIVTVAPPPDQAVDAPAAKSDCTSGWLCLWSIFGYRGARWQFRDEGYIQNLPPYGATPFQAFYNHRGHRWFLHESVNGAGKVQCYGGNTSASDLKPWYRDGESIYLAKTNESC